MPNDTADGRSTADPWSPAGKKNACIIVAGIAVAIVVLIAALLASGVLNDDSKHGGQCGDNVYYRYDESTKTLDIFVNGQGNGVMNDYDESKAEQPWTPYSKSMEHIVIGKGVTVIGNDAFYDHTSVISVDLPDGLKEIHGYAFGGCGSLKTIKIPGSVISIADSVFDDCGSLDSISVDPDNSNYTSSDGVLYDKDMSTIIRYPAGKTADLFTIPGTVVTIGDSSFERCHNLISVEIPEGVKTIDEYAFYGCDIFHSVSIPGSVEEICYSAFEACTQLMFVELNEGLKTIDGCAFCECESLEYVIIPDSVDYLGMSAFADCKSLKYASIGKGVESECIWIFDGCESLEKIDVDPDNECFSSIDGVMYNKDATVLIKYPEGRNADPFVIPDTVETVGEYSFTKTKSLLSVTISKNIEKIDETAFGECGSLHSFSVVTENPYYSSENGILYDKEKSTLVRYPSAQGQTEFTVPDTVKTIGYQAFEICKNLESVTIPGTVKSISSFAFFNCDSLVSVHLGEGIETIGSFAFDGCNSLITVTVPDSVTDMGSSTFKGCESLRLAVLGKGLTNISFTFRDCSSLVTVILPEALTEIGQYTFRGCQSLAYINLPAGLSTIHESAFEGFTFFDLKDGAWKEVDKVVDNLKGKSWSGQGGQKLYHSFQVEFELNYGSEGTYLIVWTDAEGKISEIPEDPVREGYLFDGWFTEPEGGKKVTADTQFTSDTKLYAHWKQA